MLDALVNEAQLRWGLDLGRGLQVVAAERLVGTPLEPSQPLILLPLAAVGDLRGPGPGSAADARTSDRGARAAAEGANEPDGTDAVVEADGGNEPGDAKEPDGAERPEPAEAVPPVELVPSAGHVPFEPVLLPGRHGPRGRDPLEILRRLYPAGHPVGRFGRAESTTIGQLTAADLATRLYVGPVRADVAQAGPWALPWISARLREADGCPWDREQTHESLRRHLLEEAYEVYDALGDGPTPALAGELGDLLLQIVLHAQLAAEAGIFDLVDVDQAIGAKIVRRHPHVFGEAEARTAADVNRQWEQIKKAERAEAEAEAANGTGPDGGDASPGAAGGTTATLAKSALDGISRSMPALAASQEMQDRAAHLGYDWPTVDGVIEKLQEELGELLGARDQENRREEVGDLLMVAVNLSRRHGVEAETALRAANEKFRRRFGSVERQAAARGVALRDLDFAALDELWDGAKAEEAVARTRIGEQA